MFGSEGPRNKVVQQRLNHLGLQHSDFQAQRGGHPIIRLRAEPLEACPHETDASVEFEREVSFFVGVAAYLCINTGLSVSTSGLLLRLRAEGRCLV